MHPASSAGYIKLVQISSLSHRVFSVENGSENETVPDVYEFIRSTLYIWDDDSALVSPSILCLKKDDLLPMASLQSQRILLDIHWVCPMFLISLLKSFWFWLLDLI
jgi:hypothetical protein